MKKKKSGWFLFGLSTCLLVLVSLSLGQAVISCSMTFTTSGMVMTGSSKSLASINDGQWVTDYPYGTTVPALNVFTDTSTTYNGSPTFRVDPTSDNSGADHNVISIQPGDHLVITCWIKSGGATPTSYAGARIGLDYYAASPWKRISAANSLLQASTGNRDSSDLDANYVHWGTNWTQVTWDFIVPATVVSDGGSGQTSSQYPAGQAVAPTAIIPWIQVWCNTYPTNAYSCWFSSYALYVNP
jgi:hypothetical protein